MQTYILIAFFLLILILSIVAFRYSQKLIVRLAPPLITLLVLFLGLMISIYFNSEFIFAYLFLNLLPNLLGLIVASIVLHIVLRLFKQRKIDKTGVIGVAVILVIFVVWNYLQRFI
ncbi:hypothetical protein [Bacillus sp. 1NLA3E]|uniref:hypothetical protein n=1 Tax=Bacillus sp. 1NLA3E TaxID=666686 RepID=UPI000247EAA1|nr:hypothetical protein [Bacillus sp. 1NLA3E]